MGCLLTSVSFSDCGLLLSHHPPFLVKFFWPLHPTRVVAVKALDSSRIILLMSKYGLLLGVDDVVSPGWGI
jgi:hypothetical protein